MTLVPCTSPWGNTDIYDTAPQVLEFPDVTYLPMKQDPYWGILDRYHRVILDTVTFQGTHWGTDGRSLELPRPDHRDRAPDETYIYCGRLIWHYGHFIVDVLPRLWPLLTNLRPGYKLLFHENADIESLFSVPFVNAALSVLGLSPSDFVKFDRPTAIPRLIVPQTSMRQQLYAHRVLGRLLHTIGDGIRSPAADDCPIYLSKRHVPAVLTMFVGEDEIEEEMSSAGVRIVSPEKLSFSEQIGLFSNGRIIFGAVGSALHTSAFSNQDFSIFGINGQHHINTNYLLLDEVCRTKAKYYFDPDVRQQEFSQPGSIRTEYTLQDPREAARHLLRESGIR